MVKKAKMSDRKPRGAEIKFPQCKIKLQLPDIARFLALDLKVVWPSIDIALFFALGPYFLCCRLFCIDLKEKIIKFLSSHGKADTF